MTTDPRRSLGVLGESLAARHLEARGYEVVDRNFRTRCGELDLVARDAAIGPKKQRRVRAMAREWLAARAGRGGRRPPELRFDAIGVSFDARGRLIGIEHLEDAF